MQTKRNKPGPAKYTLEQRLVAFWSKVDPCRTDGCALWLGAVSKAGYGNFWDGARYLGAHTFLVGKAPDGLEWDHVKARGCAHKACIWPEHLEAVTQEVNKRRSTGADRWRNKTNCPQGHPYDEANTRIYRGHRYCRACGTKEGRRAVSATTRSRRPTMATTGIRGQ